MSTPTMSRDNRYRIALRVEFRASIGELAAYLACAHRHVEDVDRLANLMSGLNPRQIHATIRTEMERRGCDYIDGWADWFGHDETVQRLKLAEQHVRRAFPELDKADREQKQQTTPAQGPAPVNPLSGTGDGYGMCDWCGWNGLLREDGMMRRHRPMTQAGGKSGRTGSLPQDMHADHCNGSGEAPYAPLHVREETATQEPAASEPEQTEETPAPATCRHGNTPRQDVTGNPIKACDDGFRAPGHVEYGAFNPEGCFYSGDGCAVDAANAAAVEALEADDITWGRMCNDHADDLADHCRECNAEPEPTCTDCAGSGCHWCHWTGKRR